ncbi:hypothetical protein Vretifemale_10246 [Volvox reticuliferus]|uniref:USP domain-containing protein n=1 Tax=Volvox reticuliferus TaxID=1737510 RepID=A0A8J4CG64_9CHLO|nr:hypothetical protein Vretifemale_10246 [Volvox reticuliferus]
MYSIPTKASAWNEGQDGKRSCGFALTNPIVQLPSYYPGRLARPDGCGRLLGNSFLNYSHPGFMRSVVQCLAHIPPFVEACLNDVHSAKCQHMLLYPPLGLKAARDCKRCGIECQIAVECRAFGINAGRPRDLVHTSNPWFAEIRHLSWMKCDSAGALVKVLEAVEMDESAKMPKGYNTLVGYFFNGVCRSRVTCTECGSFSDMREPFKVLPLDVKAASTVPEALEQLFQKSILTEAYRCKCGVCKKRVDAAEELKLLEVPTILILQIKRFDFNGRKNKKHIGFNLDLDLAPYMAQDVGAPQDTRYTLMGVLSCPHSDVQSVDHHPACVRSPEGDWRVIGRKEVVKVTAEELKQREAYFLFYILDGAKPPPRPPRPAEAVLSDDWLPLSQRRPSMRVMTQQPTAVLSRPICCGAASISPLQHQSPAAAMPPSPLHHVVAAVLPSPPEDAMVAMPPSPPQHSPVAAMPPSPRQQSPVAAMPPSPPQQSPAAAMPPSPLQQSPVAAMPPSPPQQSPVAAMPPSPPQQSPVAAMPPSPPQQSPVAAMPPSPLQQSPVAAMPPSPLQQLVIAAVPPPQQIMAEMLSMAPRAVVEMMDVVQLDRHPCHEGADGGSPSTAGSCSTRPPVRTARPIREIREDIRRILKEIREQRAKSMAAAAAAAAGCGSGYSDLVDPAAGATVSHKRKFEESDSGNGVTGLVGRLVKVSRLERVTTTLAPPARGAEHRMCRNNDMV